MDQGVHLVRRDNEVACDCRLALAGRLEVNHRGGSHGGWNRGTAIRDHILAWNEN
jgi:hypothetical protein